MDIKENHRRDAKGRTEEGMEYFTESKTKVVRCFFGLDKLTWRRSKKKLILMKLTDTHPIFSSCVDYPGNSPEQATLHTWDDEMICTKCAEAAK